MRVQNEFKWPRVAIVNMLSIISAAFWDLIPHSLVYIYQYYRGTCQGNISPYLPCYRASQTWRQYLHEYSVHTLVWIRRCLFRAGLCVNLQPQKVQTNGFTPVWVRRWDTRAPRSAKTALHSLHLKFFSPVCNRMCTFSM